MTSTIIETRTGLDLLADIVEWAVVDDRLISRGEQMGQQERATLLALREKFKGWGHWGQGSWALPENDWEGVTDFLAAERAEQPRNGMCGSALCMAGQATAQQPNVSLLTGIGFGAENCVVYPEGEVVPLYQTYDDVEVDRQRDDVEVMEIGDYAQNLLGLDVWEADALFQGSNSIGIIVGVAMHIAELRGQELDVPPWVTVVACSEERLEAHLADYRPE